MIDIAGVKNEARVESQESSTQASPFNRICHVTSWHVSDWERCHGLFKFMLTVRKNFKRKKLKRNNRQVLHSRLTRWSWSLLCIMMVPWPRKAIQPRRVQYFLLKPKPKSCICCLCATKNVRLHDERTIVIQSRHDSRLLTLRCFSAPWSSSLVWNEKQQTTRLGQSWLTAGPTVQFLLQAIQHA